MEALLIDQWLRGKDSILILDEASLTVVRDRIRQIGAETGAPAEVVDRACLVATEIGTNQLRHARVGRIAIEAATRGEHRGIEITGVDRGPGLRDVAGALDGPLRATGSLGVGVGSIRRLSSEADFDVRCDEGTRIAARLFDREAPRRPEVGIYGRPYPGEAVSGDHASFHRIGDALVLAICDGLGHGPPAREAADVAMRSFDEQATGAPAGILERCHAALDDTRGVVMAVARIDHDGAVETSSIGNIECQICGPRSARRFGGSSAILGGRSQQAKARTETGTLNSGELIILSTDGISSKLSVEDDLVLLRMHPIVVAQRILERFGRTNDDALVLVAR